MLNSTVPVPFREEVAVKIFRNVLDCYCRFYRPGHFEGLLSRDFHLMDVPRVELHVLD